jgi:hypothetical protein
MVPLLVGGLAGIIVLAMTRGSAAAAVLAALFAGAAYYLTLPVLAVDFAGIWLLTAATLALGGSAALTLSPHRPGGRDAIAGGIAVAAILLVGAIATTAPMFHARAYHDLLGEVPTVPFAAAVAPLHTAGPAASGHTLIEQDAVILVDARIAGRRAQELLGANPAIGSSFELGPFSQTRLNGDGPLVWAAPLDFNGFGPWSSSKGAPGYVWVDAHDARRAGYVTASPDGAQVLMRCTPQAWFGDNLERALRQHGFAGMGLTDFSFEIGPGMRPYYVVTAYRHRVGFAGSDVAGAIVFDPQTCQGSAYPMDRVPAWVNRVVPDWIVADQVTDYGRYGHGWWNAWFTGADVTAPSIDGEGRGVALVQTTRTGATAWYVGLTTPSKSTGTLGFLLVDSRTKKTRFFRQTGATEFIARGSLQGLFSQQAGWTATLPILYNIFGQPTYLSVIEDANGNFKGVGLVQVSDVNVVVRAEDLAGALQDYAAKLANEGPLAGAPAGEPIITVTGTVTRIAPVVRDGNTVFLLQLDTRPGVVFSVPDSVGPQAALTQVGEVVTLRAQTELGGVLAVRRLDNPAVLAVPRE